MACYPLKIHQALMLARLHSLGVAYHSPISYHAQLVLVDNVISIKDGADCMLLPLSLDPGVINYQHVVTWASHLDPPVIHGYLRHLPTQTQGISGII